jgi:hypothetical protein
MNNLLEDSLDAKITSVKNSREKKFKLSPCVVFFLTFFFPEMKKSYPLEPS